MQHVKSMAILDTLKCKLDFNSRNTSYCLWILTFILYSYSNEVKGLAFSAFQFFFILPQKGLYHIQCIQRFHCSYQVSMAMAHFAVALVIVAVVPCNARRTACLTQSTHHQQTRMELFISKAAWPHLEIT